jgi:hypothetical protein
MRARTCAWAGIVVMLAGCGAKSTGTEEATGPAQGARPDALGEVVVLGANDLGMHCVDKEFSVFSILPPFNVVHAQVLERRLNQKPRVHDGTTVAVTYSAVADATGSINSTTLHMLNDAAVLKSGAWIYKTDFWEHAGALFGAELNPGEGLTGLYMPADALTPGPQPLAYSAAHGWFEAFGVPITPIDDAELPNTYPLMRLTAREKATGQELAHLDVVLPVSAETDCQNCHATGGIAASSAGIPWSMDPDKEIQTKENVLLLHDAEQGTVLFSSQPVLCAGCHYSAALDLAGSGPQGSQIGNPTMSATMHAFHGKALDPQGHPVFPPNGTVEQTCYQCHPGLITQCQRGAMKNGGLGCFDCHGDMLAVGGEFPLLPGGSLDGTNDGQPRRPWMDLPRCQSCHTGDALSHLTGPGYVLAPDGIRLQQAYRQNDPSASAILATDKRFAENTNKLYRFSKGHGGITCQGCHNSTHAEWPNADPGSNDNVAALQLQGHTGPIIECGTCHAPNTLPIDSMNGPHGMHASGQLWVEGDTHGEIYEHQPATCQRCHGSNLQGTVLARMARTRTFQIEHKTVTITKGTQVTCTLCHSWPPS